MSETFPGLDMGHIYWNDETQEYRLAIVAEGKTQVLSFKGRGQVYQLAANALAALAKDHTRIS